MGFVLGLAVALCGALLLAAGSQLQSGAVVQATGRWSVFLRSPHWLLGCLLLTIAVCTNFIALALAPVSAVQSMSVTALAAATVLAARSGQIRLTRTSVAAIALCIAGNIGFVTVLAAHPPNGHPTLDPPAQFTAAVVILATLTLLGVGACALPTSPDRGWRPFTGLVVGAMVFGSVTTVFKTIVTRVLSDGLLSTLAGVGVLPALGILLAAGIVANVLLQRSHRSFPVPVVVAALTIIDPLTAAVIGITLLSEATLTALSGSTLILCGLLATTGVLAIRRLPRLSPGDRTAVFAPPAPTPTPTPTQTPTP